MQRLRGANVTVFLLFFGLSLLEAIESSNWVRAAAWLAVGILFLGSDLSLRKP